MIKTFWCDGGNNWGDVFSEFLFRSRGVTLQRVDAADADLFACGSILECMPLEFKGFIFGSGLMYPDRQCDLRWAKVFALRGYLTVARCQLHDLPTLGDPGLLAHLFAKPAVKTHKYGIIPHLCQRGHPDVIEWSRREDTLVIDIRQGVQNVINETSRCENILSSSLHGLMLADSLGILNKWVELQPPLEGHGFKFQDYYSMWGQAAVPPAGTIEEGTHQLATRDTTKIKADLITALDALCEQLTKIPEEPSDNDNVHG